MTTIRAGTPHHFATCTLIPIEKTQWHCHTTVCGFSLNASKEAVAVVIYDDYGIRAVGIDGQAMAVKALIADVPGLATMLE